MTFRITYSVLAGDLAAIHQEFEAALAQLKLGEAFPSWIAGEPVQSDDFLESRTPADKRRLLAKFHRTKVGDLPRAVQAAQKAQREWVALGWQERVARIRKAAELISERRMRLAAIMSLEVGKNRLESLGDVEESADLLRYYSGQVEESNGFTRPLGKLSPKEDTRDVLRPYGVFAVISPFNFPLALATGMSGAALLAGNAVILKPSEDAPWCGQLLYEAFRDAGLPAGLFQLLHGEGESIAAALVRQPGIDGVAFTGSTGVGLELHGLMSTGRIRPCLLEMGGKNGTIVTESADLPKAVQGCLRSSFGLSGQKCSALSRILVARSRQDELVKELVAQAKELAVGDPVKREVYMGPVINESAVARFEKAAAEARKDGTVHCGGARLTEGDKAHGYFVAPTVVSVPRGHRLTRDELFLPFVTVQPFDTFEEALTLLNEVDYGLTAGIFSGSQSEIEAFMDKAEAGVLYANRETGATTGAWPGVQSFCGWKGSGSTGKGGCGPFYVAQFAREQSQTRMG
ncbi:MAG TPA: aldehyde dehydrogenase family protein [Myxococcales bacterium]|nr:aldehyde dehydrogenase family protein [Myxococcales bacterium]